MKIYIIKYISTLSIVLIISACTKKEGQVPIYSSNQSTLVFDQAYIDGRFEISYEYWTVNDSLDLTGVVATAFVNNSRRHRDSIDYADLANIGLVSCNGAFLLRENANYYDLWKSGSTILKPFVWHISGNGAFDSLKYMDASPMPIFEGTYNLPDTLFYTKSNVINLTDFKNVDNVEVSIMDDRGTSTAIKTVRFPFQSVIFKGKDLGVIYMADGPVYIILVFYKSNVQTVNGKIYNFRTRISITKGGVFYKFKS